MADEIRNCGGHDKIENLKKHEGERIRGLAKEIIDIYFVDVSVVSLSDHCQASLNREAS